MRLNKKYTTKIGLLLKNLRKNAQMSQNDVAKRMGFQGYRYISQIETGRIEPSLEYVAKFCQITNVPVNRICVPLQKMYVDQIAEQLKIKIDKHQGLDYSEDRYAEA